MPYRQLAYLPDRRSTRINHSVLITVRGIDARHAAYADEVCTLTVNCHGCSYESPRNVVPSDVVTIEMGAGEDRRSIKGRIRSVKQPGPDRTLFEIAVELASPENIWDVAFPPADWLPRQEDRAMATPPANSGRELWLVPRSEPQTNRNEAEAGSLPAQPDAGDAASLPPLLAILAGGSGQPIQVAATAAVKEALARERGRMVSELRAQLQEELRAMLKRAVATSMDDPSGSDSAA